MSEAFLKDQAKPSFQFQPVDLLQQIGDVIIATDLHLNVISFNNAAEKIYGITAQEIMGKNIFHFIRHNFKDTSRKKAMIQLQEKGFWQGKVSFKRNDSKSMELLVNASYVLDANGKRKGIVAVNKIITEIVKIAERSRQYKLRMKSILNGAKEALFLLDSEGHLLLLNNKARHFLKKFMNKEVKRGCNFIDIFPTHRHQAIKKAIEKAIKGEDSEYEVPYPNNLWCLVNYTGVLNEYSDKKEICVSARDITARKLAEEKVKELSLLAINQQKETSRLILKTQEEMSHALGRELHDNINQILTAAKLQIETAQAMPNGYNGILQKSKKSIEEAIEEIRRLSRGLTAPELAETDLSQGISDLIENMQLTHIADVNIKNFRAERICPELKLQLFRIVQEQLKNIIKHANAKSIYITIENDQKELRLFIEDDGIGFDTDQKKKGIGFINMRYRVESFDGCMKVHSSPGKGCRLDIKVPLHPIEKTN
jgi:PAS domain S-box-containing protein